jgi:hypothetical protein
MKKYICQTDTTHVFDQPTQDGYCPKCPYLEGILVEKETETETKSTSGGNHGTIDHFGGEHRPISSAPEVGLCVILMDASSSMTDPAFTGSPLTRMSLVANSAASGIFDLQRMQNNPNAYVAAFKFDDRVELMFMDTVANIIKKYNGEIRLFAAYIFDELSKMQQGTDINKALNQAYDFVSKFLNKQMPEFIAKDYEPMRQRILKYNLESVSIANVRVLIYTDGMQYDAQGNRALNPNPFKTHLLRDVNHDIVVGAFFGQADDEGSSQLQTLLSRCPIHDELQFFLFDKPAQIGSLKYLFRMASGASGFCPKCLQKQMQ